MMRFLVCLVLLCLSAQTAFGTDVRLKCWIVSDGTNVSSQTSTSVSNLVDGVNEIYAQACMRFLVDSVSYTNDAYLANVHLTNSVQWRALSSIEQGTGMLELYFVPVLDGGATAFHTRLGVVVGPNANARTLSHEIGHACGLPDIYVRHRGTANVVQGLPSRERMPDDWGWYPPSLTQEVLIQRLLMYGLFSTTKADIPYGDIYGVYYTRVGRTQIWHLDQAPIGFGLHGNRHPVSQ